MDTTSPNRPPVITQSRADQRDLDALADELQLTERERLFCAYIASGQARSNAEAARLAGTPEGHARQEGWRLSQREGVRTFLRACTLANMQSMTVRATQVLSDLLDSSETDAKTRKEIAFGIIDRTAVAARSGAGAGQAVQVNINLGGASPTVVSEEG